MGLQLNKEGKTMLKNKRIVTASIVIALIVFIAICVILLPSFIEDYKINKIVSDYLKVTETCDSVIAEYSDENGFIELSEQTEVLEKIYNASKELEESGIVKKSYYKENDTGVVIELFSGIKCFCAPMIDGYLSGTGNAELVTVEPYNDIANDSWEHIRNHLHETGLKKPNEIASELQKEFDFLSYNNDYQGFVGSIEYLLGLEDNSIVIWRGHGGYNEECGSILGINSEGGLLLNSEAKNAKAKYAKTIIENHYSNLLDNSLLLMSNGETLAVTKDFFESIPEHAFENSLFYLAACDSIMDCFDSFEGSLSESIINKGAVAVIGNTGIIETRYNGKMLQTVFEELTNKNNEGKYKSLDEALNCAKSVHGEYDSYNQGTTVYVVCPSDSPNNRNENLPYFYGNDIEKTESTVTESIIVDALNYEKNVIPAEGLEGMGYEELKHKIRLPKITKSSENAKSFNAKIYNQLSEKYDILKNNEEYGAIYEIDYEYKVHNDVLGIVLTYSHAVQAGGGNFYYYAYYYDLENDKEISFSEYLSALSLDAENLMFLIKNTEQFRNEFAYVSDYNNISIKDCILDKNGTVAYLNNLESMDGWSKIELDTLFN